MGRKAKISYEIKFKFIEEYLNGNISQIAIARELGLHPSSIQGWIRKYKAFGPEGLKTIKKNTHYSSELKLSAVKDYINGKGSLADISLKYNLSCTYSRKIMKIGTPLKVWGLTFLLVVLASIFLGMLVVTFNIWFRRGTGTILGIFVIVFYYIMDWIPLFFDNKFAQFDGYRQIQNMLWRLEPYLSPLYQTDVYGLTLRKARPVMERVEIAAVYYIVLAVVVLVMGLRMVRKVDLSKD